MRSVLNLNILKQTFILLIKIIYVNIKLSLTLFQMKSIKKKIRVKRLEGTPYRISQDQKLGKGTYGQVYKAYNKDNPAEELVVKIISLHQAGNLKSIQAELEIIRSLPRHQNLVNCLKAHIQSENNLYIIMEFCNEGSLETYLQKMVLMPQQKIWNILTQLCKGYQVLLDQNLIHRDIKPDNILINNGVFKLADFGLSKRIVDPKVIQNLSFKGSPIYMAPEIVDHKTGSSKVDIYSLGCVMYQLAYDGASPYYDESKNYKNVEDYFKQLKGQELVLKQKNKKGQMRSIELRDLIRRMVEKDQQKRISWQQLFQHKRINLNLISPIKIERPQNYKQTELQFLKKSLIEVNRSSVKMQEIAEKESLRQHSQNMTLQLIQFQRLLNHKQLRNLQHLIFRLKITFLTIFHCNSKINIIVKQNNHHRHLHSHIIEGLKNIVSEGLIFLIKNIDNILKKIENYDESLINQLKLILVDDKQRIVEEYKKQMKIFKNFHAQRSLEEIKSYDSRQFENYLYNILTEYCDYPPEIKRKIITVISILIDIYDSSLKLIELTESEKIWWDKCNNMDEIQTKMDQICFNKLQSYEFHNYLMSKQHITEVQVNENLKKVGLLFQ